MTDLTYTTPDSTNASPDPELIGTRLLHLGRMSVYQITGFCWLGGLDEWGYLHHEVRGDGLNGPTIARPMHHIGGNRSNGKPRYGVLLKPTMADSQITKALEFAEMGQIDGAHHKDWVIDQIVRALTGVEYDGWVKEFCAGADGPETYSWEEGVAP